MTHHFAILCVLMVLAAYRSWNEMKTWPGYPKWRQYLEAYMANWTWNGLNLNSIVFFEIEPQIWWIYIQINWQLIEYHNNSHFFPSIFTTPLHQRAHYFGVTMFSLTCSKSNLKVICSKHWYTSIVFQSNFLSHSIPVLKRSEEMFQARFCSVVLS